MMCPWAARIGARRSLRPVPGALVDPVRPPERLDRISRAAPSKVAAPRTPARGRRLRSEGTDNAMRRTWSALRSIQVVVCLVLNVIEALVHPRHPPPPRGALHLPGHHSLGKVVGKVASDLEVGMRDPPAAEGGRSESERGEEVEVNEENTGRRNQNPRGSREGLRRERP